jgi:hypothetical protein
MKNNLNNIESVLKYISSLSSDDIWMSLISDCKCSDLWTDITKKASELSKSVTHFIAPSGDFTIAYHRANREFVNVGAIGITREGKSEYIARTTQLGDWLLPRRYEDQPCTTAPINIINGKSKDNKENFVRIHFFTVSEMIEQLRNYVLELGGNLDINPNNITTKAQLANWLKEHKDEVDKDLSRSSVNLSKKSEFIEGYFCHADQYVNQLIEDPSRECQYIDLSIDKVKEGHEDGELYYSSVSYYSRPDSQSSEKLYKSYATKFAEVYTQFDVANEQVSNIQFLDTPGIGEQKVGLERALSDAVAMNLDVIIVVKSVRNELNSQDANRNTLITLLRDRLNKKEYAPKSVYFLLNMWKNVSYEKGAAEKHVIQHLLQEGFQSSPIILGDSQFRMINIVDNYEMMGAGTDNDDPLGRYLSDIFHAIIPRIGQIDNDYFGKTETEYHSIMQQWKGLCNDMRSLIRHLPDTSNVSLVNNTIEAIGKELMKIATWNGFLREEINTNLTPFKESTLGTYVLKLLKYKNDKYEDVLSEVKFMVPNETNGSEQVDSCGLYQSRILAFCTAHKQQIDSSMLSENEWRENTGFTMYNGNKTTLQKLMVDDIQKLIDDTSAKEKLSGFKKSIARAFMNNGRLTFISHNPNVKVSEDSWWEDMLAYLQGEQGCSSIEKILRDVKDLQVDAKGELKGCIEKSIAESLHFDNFGNEDDGYNFQDYDSAIRSYVHSMLTIEDTAKKLIEEKVMNEALKKLEDNITSVLSKVIDLCKNADNVFGVTATRSELEAFYYRHIDDVLNGDKQAKIHALVSNWKNIIPQENGRDNG